MKAFGWAYIKDFWNVIQLGQIGLTFYRLSNFDVKSEQIPLRGYANYDQMKSGKATGDGTHNLSSTNAILNVALIFFSVLQTLYFLRTFKNFGKLV